MMKRDLVIILIIAHKSELSEFEEISLAQCYRILNNHPIKLVCPKGLDVSCYRKINNNIEIDFINPKWQANYRAFNRLKIDPFLYQRYSNYEFILFYELDAFVFRDDLNYWCSQNYDYIGAPWFNDFNPVTGHYSSIDVGNGGFSLRKVNSALKALYSFSLITNPKFIWDNWQDRGRPLRGLVSLIKNCTISNNSFYLFKLVS